MKFDDYFPDNLGPFYLIITLIASLLFSYILRSKLYE